MKKNRLVSLVVACAIVGPVVASTASCGKKEAGDAYTYRLAVDSLPTAWNTHTYQSNTATYILDYTEDSFYTFDYNDTKDGYKMVTSMAKEFPQDVTSEYSAENNVWGITEEDSWRAVRVEIRDDLYFENGDHITANDFVESLKLLLNPDAANYRADSVYGGQFSIVNAENYVKQGRYNYKAMVSAEYLDEEYFDPSTATPDKDGVLQITSGDIKKDLVLNIDDGSNWGGALSDYFDPEGTEDFKALVDLADENGYVKLTADSLLKVQNLIAILHGYENVEKYAEKSGDYAYQEFEEMCYFGYVFENIEFENVGVKAHGEYAIDYIIEKPLSGFYLTYNLAGSMSLVNTKMYKACTTTNQGVYTNSYGTSKKNYVGFGPYKISSYTSGSVVKFEKNEKWYGYKLEENKDLYQTTNISIQQVADAETRLNMFLTGKLDSYGLQADDMDTYQSSKYIYYTEGDSTWFVALNPNYTSLKAVEEKATPATAGNEVNKTILTLKKFRQAMSFSIDRDAYELTLDPTGSVAKSIYGNVIVSDPETGTAYRTTDEAKKVIVNFWGLGDAYGEGKEYATIDDAIASITGYDLAGAKKLFDEAYDEAVELGYISAAAAESGKFEVQIVIGQPGSGESAYYNNGYEFLKKTWTDAVKGTKLEGKLVFTQSQALGSTGFSEYLQNNSVDVLFGVGWTGSALDPYSLMEAYVSPNYQYDPGWNTKTTMLDVVLNGKTLRASVYNWGYVALQGGTIVATVIDDEGNATTETVKVNAGADAENAVRLTVLAAVEGAVLEQYDMIPVGLDASAALKGKRIKFYTEEYVYGMGRGGLKYYTYEMTDKQWADYVSSQGGTLNYQ